MTTQFEFRLCGADAPDGKLDAEHLLAIVQSLKDTATRLGRVEADAAERGRPSKGVERVSRLRIGMERGSTRIIVERSVDEGALDFDLADEQAVDVRFQELVDGIASDERPAWVNDSQAAAAADLVTALQRAAPEVEFAVAGTVRATFRTARTHRETWRPRGPAGDAAERVTIVGRLEKVDLRSHDLRIRDDVGNAFALPKVADDLSVSHLIGSYVTVDGHPDRDRRGQIKSIRNAAIVGMPEPVAGAGIPPSLSLERILAGVSGLEPGGIPSLTDTEADAFFEAMGM